MVDIQGIKYPVVVVENDFLVSAALNCGAVGRWTYGEGIEISDILKGDAALPTLMHEIIHGMDEAMDIRIDEHQVQLLATGFIQLMQANGGDVDWLRNMLEVGE